MSLQRSRHGGRITSDVGLATEQADGSSPLY
jgi:hypothetical protein